MLETNPMKFIEGSRPKTLVWKDSDAGNQNVLHLRCAGDRDCIYPSLYALYHMQPDPEIKKRNHNYRMRDVLVVKESPFLGYVAI